MSGNPYLEPSLGRLLIDHARIGHTFFRPRNSEMERHLALAVEHHDTASSRPSTGMTSAVVDLVFEHWSCRAATCSCTSPRKGAGRRPGQRHRRP
jgi:DNA-binding GntR family transcriptional regulator